MHPLIDPKIVETIRSTGGTSEHLPDRVEVLGRHGLPVDRPAENVIVSGCQVVASVPHVLASLSRLLTEGKVSHTFLAKEFCCGNYLYRPAIRERDEAALAECRELSKEFAARNLEQARALGARRLVIFCSPCYPIYKHAFPEADIVFYPAAIAEMLGPFDVDEKIDYYPGCYRLHRRFSAAPMDLASTEAVFGKMRGLEIHRIGAPKCCFDPDGLSHMVGSVETATMVHICTGCYAQARTHVPENRGTRVLMLPEFVEAARTRVRSA